MTEPTKHWTRHVPFLRLVAPKGFLKLAAALALAFLVCHLLGWREHTSFLSGTMPAGGNQQAVMGLLYFLAYFGAVLAVPILVLAAGIFALLLRWGRRKSVGVDDAHTRDDT